MAKPIRTRTSKKFPDLAIETKAAPVGKVATGLRYRDLEVATGYTERHIRRLVRQGAFPPPEKIDGGHILVWPVETVEAWLASKEAA